MAGPPKTSSLVATRQLCLEIAEVTRGCVLCQSVTVPAEGGGQSISACREVLCRFAVTLRASFVVIKGVENIIHRGRPSGADCCARSSATILGAWSKCAGAD